MPESAVRVRQSRQRRLADSRAGNVLVLAVVTALVLAGAWWMSRPTTGEATAVDVAFGEAPPPVAGADAFAFQAPTVDGSTFDLAAERGAPVWLSFVATWCSSCRAEAPDIQDAWSASDGSVTMASVYLGEDLATVGAYAKRLGMDYPQVADPDGAISGEYRIMAVPSHVFITSDGTVHSTHVGVLTREEMDRILAELG